MSIVNNDSNALVSGTSGNDNITNYGSNVTINAESGNDTINNDAGNNVTINGGYGNDKVLNKDSYVMINGNSGDDFLWSGYSGDGNYPECVTLDGGTGKDTLQASGDHTLLIGGEGDDSIKSSGAHEEGYNTIFAGNGNDSIISSTPHSIIYGGEGNDLLDNEGGQYSTIVGGAGDDYIKLWYGGENGSVIEYTEGDGNDVVMFQGNEYYVSRIPNVNFSILKGSYTVERFDGVDSGLLIKVGNGSIRVFRVGTININGVPVTVENSTSSTTSTTPTSTNTPTVTAPATVEPSTNTNTTTTPTVTTPETITPVNTTSTPTVTVGGGDTIINNYYYGDYYDNSNNNGTIIINSNVEGDVTNNTTVDNSITIVKEGDTYTYNGGDKVIDNYQQGEVVELASDYAGIDLKENSFFVKSSSGQLEIQNSRDKFIGYSAESEVVAYSYVASGGGNVDGRDKNVAEIMIGGDNANNQIMAGSGGSSLWGGNGGNDILTGGAGYDEFFYAVGSGSDIMQSVGDNDLINLASVNLSQISGVDVKVGQVNINFVDGGSLQVQGGSGVAYRIAEGTFAVNQSTNQWSAK